MMTKVNIDLWVLLAGVALPSACLLMVSLVYCWRRLSRRHRANAGRGADPHGFNQQVLLEMVLQQTDNALNSIVDAVQEQRIQLLKVLETHQLPLPATAPVATSVPERTDGAAASEPTPKVPASAYGSAETQAPAEVSKVTSDGMRPTPPTDLHFDPYSRIPDLLHEGLSVAEVATRLNLPESAVDLYKSLRMADGKGGDQKTA
jgi:hypothetical protein